MSSSTQQSPNTEQAVTLLYEAKESLEQCIGYLYDYVRLTGDRRTERTLIRNLQVFVNHDHGILAREYTIQDVLNQYFEDEGESDLEHEHDFA
jgi:hypothetical protein